MIIAAVDMIAAVDSDMDVSLSYCNTKDATVCVRIAVNISLEQPSNNTVFTGCVSSVYT